MNLKEIRLKRGMKLCELAEAIGLSSQAVYYYETGAREPNLETLRKLKESLQFRRIPILLITDDGTMQYEASGLRLGAEDNIRKPFVSEALMMRIRRIIDLAHCRHNYAHLSEMEEKSE